MGLDIYNLEKRYTNFNLKIEEFHSQDSEIIGLVGNNGAGKTTFLKLLLDLLLPDSGEIYSNNALVNLSEHWKDYTGSFLDEDFLIQFLTPLEFFRFIGRIYDLSEKLIESRLLRFKKFLNMDFDKSKYIREYSTGNKYKIGIVSTLITKPKVLIFDEPFNYLDPTSQNQLSLILKEYKSEENALILLSSHDLTHITELCSRILIISNGNIIKDIQNKDQENTIRELNTHFMI